MKVIALTAVPEREGIPVFCRIPFWKNWGRKGWNGTDSPARGASRAASPAISASRIGSALRDR